MPVMVKVLQSAAVLAEEPGCSAGQGHLLRVSPCVSTLNLYLTFRPKMGMQASLEKSGEKKKPEEGVLRYEKSPYCLEC